MPFTADEVEHKRFLTTLRGYDKAEVDAFLRAVADDLRRYEASDPAEDRVTPELVIQLRAALEDALALRAAAIEDAAVFRAEGDRRT